jgi:hypothetical protein
MLLLAADTPALAADLFVRAPYRAFILFALIPSSQLDESSLKPEHWNYLQPPSAIQVSRR